MRANLLRKMNPWTTDALPRLPDYPAMTVATTFTRAETGIEAPLVTIEVHLSNGLPRTHIVGLAETAVRESKDRVKSALINSRFDFPKKVITINLGPADLPKQGCRYDLPIALGILSGINVFPADRLGKYEFMGELGLNGDIKPVPGVLPAATQTINSHRSLIISRGNSLEASLLKSPEIYVADHLSEVVGFLKGLNKLSLARDVPVIARSQSQTSELRLSDVKGQQLAKRALIIAAAGAHNILLMGPPGTGKTMLAARLPVLLPALDAKESLELASIQSVANRAINPDEWGSPPFRCPHHTASAVALCGGGSKPMPGEISLAHHGVLFLDELPEYSRQLLEVLREPLETGQISISRARYRVTYPAKFQLVATMNPCPCGYSGRDDSRCVCSQETIQKYRRRLSGPLMDRIDLHVEVPPLPKGILSDPMLNVEIDTKSEPGMDRPENEHLAALVNIKRVRKHGSSSRGKPNARLSTREVEKFCKIGSDSRKMLDDAVDRLGLSARGYYKVLRIALTIAELEVAHSKNEPKIRTEHLAEAINYRKLDRFQNATKD